MNALREYRTKHNISQHSLALKLGYRWQSDIFYREQMLDRGRGLKPQDAEMIAEKTGIKINKLLFPGRF